ncbi:DUF6651 domain-containing protein [Rugamonas sp.]|uniref:DUF6651 domain-containing protein n=1 Tax=Rugamonas sp. TaxID=1926287 RepID=UPI0025D87B1A|nr:DUF6651 domain-containing protein [Rugamonas sp.]
MKIKTTPDGKHAILKNGVPVYVMDNGTEREIDGAAAWRLALSKHFETSPVMAGLKLPADVAASFFGDAFRIEAGKLVAVDKHGIQMYSPTRHGEAANFDEAFAQLVDRYESKSIIQREPGAGGAPGAAPAAGQQPAGATVSRAAFDAMPQDTRVRFLGGGGRISDSATGAAPAAPPPTPTGKTVTRAAFDVMGTQERGAHFKAGGKVVD